MARKPTFDYDLIVIGSGAAGSAAALLVAQAGRRVALIEAGEFGGESPNWGDVPMATMLHIANLFDEAKHGDRFGIRSGMLGYNYPSILRWKDLTIRRTGAGGNQKYYESEGIDTYRGVAHFLSPHEVTVNRRHLSSSHFLIATGSHIEAPDIFGLAAVRYLTPQSILNLTRPPRSLFIIGSDSVAIEYAQLMATFGTKVYISEVASRLLPEEDSEVGELLERLLHEQKGVTCLTQTQVISVEKKGLGSRVSYVRGGTTREVQVDEILICSTRRPTVDLGLENAGIRYSPRGIDIDDHLTTSLRHIYAAGEVIGDPCSTQRALLQSQIVAHNILHPKSRHTPDYTALTRVTRTHPGIASVGLTEDDCLKRDLRIRKSVAPLRIIARSNTSDFRDGFVKILVDTRGVILGATIMAPHAGEMIHELTLAIQHRMTAADIAATPHAFLSWNEAVRVAASKLI